MVTEHYIIKTGSCYPQKIGNKIHKTEDFYSVSSVTTVIWTMRQTLVLSYTVVNTDLLTKGWIQVGWKEVHLPLH